jgi:hypothetical protein
LCVNDLPIAVLAWRQSIVGHTPQGRNAGRYL